MNAIIETQAFGVPLNPRRLNVDEFHKMISAGIFRREDHVELVNGILIEMHMGEPHKDAIVERRDDGMPLPLWRLTADNFQQMAATGIFKPDERLELVDGEIVQMAPIGGPHAAAVRRLNGIFSRSAATRAIVAVQDPIRLSERIELYPDLALLRPRDDFYGDRHPGPDDVMLVIEVSDATLRYDRRVKLPLYAAAGIPEYWIFDVAGRQAFVFRDPAEGAYRVAETPGLDDPIASALLPDLRLTPREAMG